MCPVYTVLVPIHRPTADTRTTLRPSGPWLGTAPQPYDVMATRPGNRRHGAPYPCIERSSISERAATNPRPALGDAVDRFHPVAGDHSHVPGEQSIDLWVARVDQERLTFQPGDLLHRRDDQDSRLANPPDHLRADLLV